MVDTLLHPFTIPTMTEAEMINIARAEGSNLWDTDGKEYLDCLASLWYCQVGYGRKEIIDAIKAQLDELVTYHIFSPFTNDPAAAAAEAVAQYSPHPDGRVFFGNSGSEAIDSALKIARLVQQVRGHTDKQIIVRRTRGYHGTNFGGTSAQGIAPNRDGWGDLVPHFVEVDPDDIEDAARVFAEHGDRIAAVVTEPVQGAGGVFMPPEGYLADLRRLCDANGALLIHDEVICGFGRTGSWFASQTFGVTPDLITFAKGASSGYLPASGVIASRGVADVLEGRGELFRHGYTYSGHPTCMAAVKANIDLIASEGLVDRAKQIGEWISHGLAALKSDGLIQGFEGIGALWGIEIGRDAVPVRDQMMKDHGVIVRPIGTRLALCPPLVITEAEIGLALDSIEAALK